MTVASEGIGRGTDVTILLPLAADGSERPAPPVIGIPQRELKGLRLLVVEDMDDARETTAIMLERLGAEVVTARDGVEALDKVRRPPLTWCCATCACLGWTATSS